MKHLWFCLLVSLCASTNTVSAAPQRVVTLGGSVTEIVYELGQGGRLVADDLSSSHPEAAIQLPRVGYYRALSLEGILSMQPDLVLASENAGPPHVLERVQGMGVRVERVSDGSRLSSLFQRVEQIALALGVPRRGAALSSRIRADIDSAQTQAGKPLRALLLMGHTGQLLAAGQHTAANEILTLAGLSNVFATHEGYQPLSAEGIAGLAPELIVVTTASLSPGEQRALLAQPGIAATPAAQASRVLVMDDLLVLGLGPRTGEAIRMLKRASR